MKHMQRYECVVWEKGAVVEKKEGSALPLPVSSHFIVMFGLSPFRGPDDLRTWNRLIWHEKGYFFHDLQCTSFKFQRVCKTIAAHSNGCNNGPRNIYTHFTREVGQWMVIQWAKAHTFIGQWMVEPFRSVVLPLLKLQEDFSQLFC